MSRCSVLVAVVVLAALIVRAGARESSENVNVDRSRTGGGLPSYAPPSETQRIVADKFSFQQSFLGEVAFSAQIGDNDGYGYGAGSVPDGSALPPTGDPLGFWFFDNRSPSELAHPYAVATDHEQWNQQDYTLVYTFDPAWFGSIDSAFYQFDLSGVQQVNMCPDNPTGRSHLLFDGVEQTAFLSINQGTLGSGVYRYWVDAAAMLGDGQLEVLFDQHNDCMVAPYGDVWAIDFARLTVYGQEAPVPIPNPISPVAGAVVPFVWPTLEWTNEGTPFYQMQISLNPAFMASTDYSNITDTVFTVPQPLTAGIHYWRVAAQSVFGTIGAYSAVDSFRVTESQGGDVIFLDHVDGLDPIDTTKLLNDVPLTFHFRVSKTHSDWIFNLTNGFRVYSPDAASWSPISGIWNPAINWLSYYDAATTVSYAGATGSGSDTVGFSGAAGFQLGFPTGYSEISFLIQTEVDSTQSGKTLCIDSAFFPSNGQWIWYGILENVYPEWLGPYCWTISGPSCCQLRGNVNGSGDIDISDLTFLVGYMFKGGPEPPCVEEANVNGQGDIDISDLTYLVGYMFKSGPEPTACS